MKKKKKKEIERQIETGKELGRKFITIKQKVMIFLLKSIKYAIALLNQLKNWLKSLYFTRFQKDY